MGGHYVSKLICSVHSPIIRVLGQVEFLVIVVPRCALHTGTQLYFAKRRLLEVKACSKVSYPIKLTLSYNLTMP